MAQETNSGNTENALGWVQEDNQFPDLCEQGAKMLVMFPGRMAEKMDFVNVSETKW